MIIMLTNTILPQQHLLSHLLLYGLLLLITHTNEQIIPTSSSSVFATAFAVISPVTSYNDILSLADIRYAEFLNEENNNDEHDDRPMPHIGSFRTATYHIHNERTTSSDGIAISFLARSLDTNEVMGAAELSSIECNGIFSDETTFGFYVTDVVTSRHHRRKGIGAKLMNEMERTARNAGARWLLLHVAYENTGAIRFYEALGYKAPSGEDLVKRGMNGERLMRNAEITEDQLLLCKDLRGGEEEVVRRGSHDDDDRRQHGTTDRQMIERQQQQQQQHTESSLSEIFMLYIPLEVNSHPIQAFVDSGAESTIMSRQTAEKCGILLHHLDTRFAGRTTAASVRGFGTGVKILGRVESCPITINGHQFPCTITVVESDDDDDSNNVEFFSFGLDMLKRHRCRIDLDREVLGLKLETTGMLLEVGFLHEKDL